MNKSHALMHAFANGGGAPAAPAKKTKGEARATKAKAAKSAGKTKAKPAVKKKNR